jgi:histidyl-tRNA synthetase
MILRNNLFSTLRRIFERYGFSPVETPVLERFDILAAKYAGGSEILKETFRLNDQGGRDLCLRYDLTVPFARYVGMRRSLKMPFKRYAIGPVFRDGPIKLGRYREFYQCDADIVGTKSMLADADCIKIFQAFFKEIDMDVIIKVNNRKVLDTYLSWAGVAKDKLLEAVLIIDKLDKIGLEEVKKELRGIGCDDEVCNKIEAVLDLDGDNQKLLAKLEELIGSCEGIDELKELLSYLDDTNVEISFALARGLAYYTGTVFEVFLADGSYDRALGSGGRYDSMIGEFVGGGREYPAVGCSFGIEPITDMLKKQESLTQKTVTEIFIVPIKTVSECVKIADQLRSYGLNVDMDLLGKGISKNLEYCNFYNIPFALIVGENELASGRLQLKNMATGEKEELTVEEIVKKLVPVA